MKILESYKKMAKSMLTEHAWDRKFGEPLPTLEYRISEEGVKDKKIKFKDKDGNDKEATVGGILKKGEDHPAYDDAKAMMDKGKDGEEEEPSGKLGGGDFERDFEDDPDDIDNLDTALDDDPTRGDPDDSWDDEEGKPKPKKPAPDSRSDTGKPRVHVNPHDDRFGQDADDEPSGEPEDEVDGKKYGGKFSEDGDHFFDAVADTAEEGNPQYKELMDADGDYDKFKEGVDNLPDGPAKEHLQNMMSHIEAGTYSDEFPSGARGVKAAQAELMDKFRQAATYYDYGEGKEHGRTGKELGKNETLMINGKKYRRVQEQKGTSKKYSLRETYERIGGK